MQETGGTVQCQLSSQEVPMFPDEMEIVIYKKVCCEMMVVFLSTAAFKSWEEKAYRQCEMSTLTPYSVVLEVLNFFRPYWRDGSWGEPRTIPEVTETLKSIIFTIKQNNNSTKSKENLPKTLFILENNFKNRSFTLLLCRTLILPSNKKTRADKNMATLQNLYRYKKLCHRLCLW